MVIKSKNPEQTRFIGEQLAHKTSPGTVYGLVGTLGSGKTELVRGFVSALAPEQIVRSPSFTLINTYYTDSFPIHHLDFYRLTDPDELIEIGFNEYIESDAVCLIEWADMFPDVMPEKTRYIKFSEEKRSCRIITVDE